MVEIKSPANLKEIEGRLGVSFRGIAGKGGRRELYDPDKLLTIQLKKGEAIVLVDSEHRIRELRRSKKGGIIVLETLRNEKTRRAFFN